MHNNQHLTNHSPPLWPKQLPQITKSFPLVSLKLQLSLLALIYLVLLHTTNLKTILYVTDWYGHVHISIDTTVKITFLHNLCPTVSLNNKMDFCCFSYEKEFLLPIGIQLTDTPAKWVSKYILSSTSSQLRYTVPFTLANADKYRTQDNLKMQTIEKLHTTQKSKLKKAKQNYSGLVAFYNTRPGNKVGLFYNAPKPTQAHPCQQLHVITTLTEYSVIWQCWYGNINGI